jgi:hypothetical protein
MQNAAWSARNQVRWYRKHLPTAQCIYITSELLDVIEAAAHSIPEDHTLSRTDLPTPAGFAVFERPIIGRGVDVVDDERQIIDMRVDAVSWGELGLPAYDADITDPEALADPTGRKAIGLAAYRFLEHDQGDFLSDSLGQGLLTTEDEGWILLGRTDWIYGDSLKQASHQDIGWLVQETMIDDKRLLLSIWSLIQQKRVVESTPLAPQRPVRRRLARRGHSAPEVTVVHLRRPEYTPRHSDGSTGRKVGVRFMVRPHWRHQACGPNRSQRRLILVPPHIKGPIDAPLTHSERVWSVDR